MGWTGSFVYSKPSKDEELKLIESLYLGENLEMLEASKVGSVWYLAVRNKRTNVVFAVIVLTSYRQGEYLTKAMGDDECPHSYDVPLKILKMLSPTDNEYANKWRKTCMEKREKKNTNGNVPLSDSHYMEVQMENGNVKLRKHLGAWYEVGNKRSSRGYFFSVEDNLKDVLSKKYPNTPAKVTKHNESDGTKETVKINEFSELSGRRTAPKRKTRKNVYDLNVRSMF